MRITPACWGSRASASTAPTTSARRGTGRSARAAPRCSRSSRTRRRHRCHRTSAWSRPRAWRLRCSRATRPPRRWSRSPSRASSRSSRPGEARAEEHPLRAPPALARARVRPERAAAGVRDLPRALQGLVRRPLGMDPDRPHAAAAGGGRGRGAPERGAHRTDGAPRHRGALRAVRDRRHGAARARRRPQAGRLLRAHLQPRDGPAAARARLARARGRHGGDGGAHAPRALMSGYKDAWHLPKRRGDGRPAPPEGLPRQRRGTTPQMRARYPDYDVLEEVGHWDDATREVVLGRLGTPPLRFFDEAEAASLRAVCDVVLAQDEDPRIPVLEHVDAKLAAGKLEGYQYADLPDDRDTWRLAARGLDEAAP